MALGVSNFLAINKRNDLPENIEFWHRIKKRKTMKLWDLYTQVHK